MTYQELAQELGRSAAKIILDNFHPDGSLSVVAKEDDSPVTKIDLEVNALVIERVRAERPQDAIIGEEESFGDPRDAALTWVCDPIDGTVPFTVGMPTFAFSLAVLRDGETIYSVIVDPVLSRTFIAELNKGATCNGEALKISARTDGRRAVIGFEYFAYSPLSPEFRQRLLLDFPFQQTLMSYVYSSILVAMGGADAAIYSWTRPWDAAAVSLLVAEAGGVVSDFKGNSPRFDGEINGFVVSRNAPTHAAILAALASEDRVRA